MASFREFRALIDRSGALGIGQTLLSDLARCLRFYSRLPVPKLPWERDPHGPPEFETMPRVLPVAGAIIGLVGAATLLTASALGLGALVSAALTITALTLVTGAFHEDGLADTADGFGGGLTPVRRLEIMADSRIGSYGGAALIAAYALRILCLGELIAKLGSADAAIAVVVVAALSRTAGLVLITFLSPVRLTGASYAAGQPTRGTLAIAWLVCGVIGSMAAFSSALTAIALVLTFVLAATVALAMTALSRRLIGGQTGDVGGATQQIAEIAAFLGLLIAARP